MDFLPTVVNIFAFVDTVIILMKISVTISLRLLENVFDKQKHRVDRVLSFLSSRPN
jgi:hypothetical protein